MIILNIGYNLGMLSPEIFAIMVIMALVTTFMTGPAISLINEVFRDPVSASVQTHAVGSFRILISIANPALRLDYK